MAVNAKSLINGITVVILLLVLTASVRVCGDGDMTATVRTDDSFSYQTQDYECREYGGTVTCKGRSRRYEW